MIPRPLPLLACAAALLSLASCNSSPRPQAVATTQAPQQRVVSPLTPQNFKLPEGAGCTGAIARYRAVVANDQATVTRALAGVVFFMLTAPISAHLLAKAAYSAGYKLWSGSVCDEMPKVDR